MAINGVNNINLVSPANYATTKIQDDKNNEVSFSDFLADALNKANNTQLEADKASEDFAVGKTDNIHDVMIAAEKADLILQFTMQIRNKIMDAYNEIMRIQI